MRFVFKPGREALRHGRKRRAECVDPVTFGDEGENSSGLVRAVAEGRALSALYGWRLSVKNPRQPYDEIVKYPVKNENFPKTRLGLRDGSGSF